MYFDTSRMSKKSKLIQELNMKCTEESKEATDYLKLSNEALVFDPKVAKILNEIAEEERQHALTLTKLVKGLSVTV